MNRQNIPIFKARINFIERSGTSLYKIDSRFENWYILAVHKTSLTPNEQDSTRLTGDSSTVARIRLQENSVIQRYPGRHRIDTVCPLDRHRRLDRRRIPR